MILIINYFLLINFTTITKEFTYMKKFSYALVIGLILVLMAACGSTNDAENNTENDAEAEENETVTIEHELGETEVEKNPEKVVVFDFGTLDSLDKLDVDVAGV